MFNRDADALEGACISLNAKLEKEDTPTRDGGGGRGTPSTMSRRGSLNDVAEIGVESRPSGATLNGENSANGGLAR